MRHNVVPVVAFASVEQEETSCRFLGEMSCHITDNNTLSLRCISRGSILGKTVDLLFYSLQEHEIGLRVQ